jgi:hypothetical protein
MSLTGVPRVRFTGLDMRDLVVVLIGLVLIPRAYVRLGG